MTPCDSLPNGLREICAGETAHTAKKRHAYLTQWLANGKIERLPDGYVYDPSQEPPAAPKKSRGLGDTIAKMTTALGIKPCGGCKGRQETLNRIVPYGSTDLPADQSSAATSRPGDRMPDRP